MFISPPVNGHFYLAQQSRRSQKYIWVKIPRAPLHNGEKVQASEVPREIRNKAYKLFEGDRLRATT